jgi:hypothetical protein
MVMTDGDLTDDKIEVLRYILSQVEGELIEKENISELIQKVVSNDIASEVLSLEESLSYRSRGFILNSCSLLFKVMSDPGLAQEQLLIKIAAAMGFSERELRAHLHKFEESATPASEFETEPGRA